MTQLLPARNPKSLKTAVEALHGGDVIALPTDTVYGVGALAFNPQAIANLYRLKRRPADKALPVFVANVDAISQVCPAIPAHAYPLLMQFLPGALTVILPARANIPAIVTHGGNTIAVRIPNHPVVLKLLAALNQPLAVTSANLSGHPTPATAIGVAAQLGESLSLILDDGKSPDTQPSTIIDLTQSPPKILREGRIFAKDLRRYF